MKGFIIYSTYRIEDNKAKIYLFGKLENGESFQTISTFRPYFFIKKEDLKKALEFEKKGLKFDHEETKLKSDEHEMVKIIIDMPADVKDLREKFESKNIKCYEADIRFVTRFLIDKQIRGSLEIEGKHEKDSEVYVDRVYKEPKISSAEYFPELKTISFDIETDEKASKIFCLSLYSKNYKKTLIVSETKVDNAVLCENEKELLEKFVEEIRKQDPDIITGWNIIDFDFAVLRERFKHHKVHMKLGRNEWDCKLRIQTAFFIDSKADFPGRMVLDGIHLLKGSFVKLNDYKLNTAAKQLLGKEKIITSDNRHNEIEKLYKSNKPKLIDYNLHDARLVYEILEKTDVLGLTIQRSLLTGMQLDRVNASIASLDFVYLMEARKQGIVVTSGAYLGKEERIKGGFVMSSKPGIYKNILILDFKSLYPSIIRTFNIDPLAFVEDAKKYKKSELIEAPNRALFVKKEGILPKLIQRLWKQRDLAKKQKNKLASNAIKILMNSFFGVLSNPMCRFYNLDVANAITHFGQHLIKLTAKLIEELGYEVIYGDTDSIFVDSKAKNEEEAERIGRKIEKHVNDFYENHIKKEYGMPSYLELEFEKIYLKFLMPKVRSGVTGAKKRYAGVVKKDGQKKIEVVGLEFVRRDWTEVAKKFQVELLDKIFNEKDVTGYVRTFVSNLKKGKYDDLLIYRKAIRKGVEEYTKTTPPHVKAARMLDKIEGNIIEYYITKDGPQPLGKVKSKIDYEHYIEKQIKPLADSILVFFGQNFDELIAGHKQKSLGDF